MIRVGQEAPDFTLDQGCSLRDAGWLTLLDDVVVLDVGSDGAYAHREYATN